MNGLFRLNSKIPNLARAIPDQNESFLAKTNHSGHIQAVPRSEWTIPSTNGPFPTSYEPFQYKRTVPDTNGPFQISMHHSTLQTDYSRYKQTIPDFKCSIPNTNGPFHARS